MSKTFTRRSFLRITGALGAAAGLTATISACAPASNDAGMQSSAPEGPVKDDGTIEAAISYELGTNGYDPMTTTSALTVAVNWHTFEGLTEMDPATGEIYAALAQELPKGGDAQPFRGRGGHHRIPRKPEAQSRGGHHDRGSERHANHHRHPCGLHPFGDRPRRIASTKCACGSRGGAIGQKGQLGGHLGLDGRRRAQRRQLLRAKATHHGGIQ